MIPVEDVLVDHATRTQVYLERLKRGIINKQEVMLQRTDRAIRDALSNGISDRQALIRALAATDESLDNLYAQHLTEIKNDMVELGNEVAQYETRFLNTLVPPSVAPIGKMAVATFVAPTVQQDRKSVV